MSTDPIHDTAPGLPRLLEIMAEPLARDGNMMAVPDGPGLGIEMREDAVRDQARHVQTLRFEG